MGKLSIISVAEGRNSEITSSTPPETPEERISINSNLSSHFEPNLMSGNKCSLTPFLLG